MAQGAAGPYYAKLFYTTADTGRHIATHEWQDASYNGPNMIDLEGTGGAIEIAEAYGPTSTWGLLFAQLFGADAGLDYVELWHNPVGEDPPYFMGAWTPPDPVVGGLATGEVVGQQFTFTYRTELGGTMRMVFVGTNFPAGDPTRWGPNHPAFQAAGIFEPALGPVSFPPTAFPVSRKGKKPVALLGATVNYNRGTTKKWLRT